jgi:membrane peptidoglycan carboxypeptidase
MGSVIQARERPAHLALQGRARKVHRSHNGRSGRRLVIKLAAALLGLMVITVAAVVALTAAAPSVADAPQRVAAILAAHGAPSDHGVVPQKVATALLATEDSRYYEDPALDPLGVARAAWGLVTHNGNDGGATIEQQLAKLLYAPGTSLGDELRQVGIAFRLDHRFTKTQILAMYLDAAYFGDGAYGVTEASLHYFGRPPEELSWAQASLLAGLVQAPSAYDPHGHLALAKARQAHVLARLVATGHMSSAEAKLVFDDPLDPAIPFYG